MHQRLALGGVALMILCSSVGSVTAEEKKPTNAIRVHQRPHQIPNHHHHHGNGGEPLSEGSQSRRRNVRGTGPQIFQVSNVARIDIDAGIGVSASISAWASYGPGTLPTFALCPAKLWRNLWRRKINLG